MTRKEAMVMFIRVGVIERERSGDTKRNDDVTYSCRGFEESWNG